MTDWRTVPTQGVDNPDAALAVAQLQAEVQALKDGGGNGGSQTEPPLMGTGSPVAPANESFYVGLVGSPNASGAFALAYGGHQTAPLAFDATGTEIVAALAGLPGIGAGNVGVGPTYAALTPNDNGPIVGFIGTLAGQPLSIPTVVDDTTDNGISVSENVVGAPGTPDVNVDGTVYIDNVSDPLQVWTLWYLGDDNLTWVWLNSTIATGGLNIRSGVINAAQSTFTMALAASNFHLADSDSGCSVDIAFDQLLVVGSHGNPCFIADGSKGAPAALDCGGLGIMGLPTANPGPGLLWNNGGTPAIGT